MEYFFRKNIITASFVLASITSWAATGSIPIDSCETTDTIFKIKTVFHVVYLDSSQNISDSVIYSQLEVINEDYSKKNADTASIRQIFSALSTAVHFKFVLADTDPYGNPTSGITRTASNAPASGFLPGADLVVVQFPSSNSACVKRTARKGIDPWPTDQYLNIWVCKVNGAGTPLKAYAYPPQNAGWQNLQAYQTDSSVQGVVVDYSLVGRENFAGRTLTHEIGHYFGLKHLHGQSGGCSDDDGFDDTPKQTGSSILSCDSSSNTCTDTGIDLPDQMENFMDDNIQNLCKSMFTPEQATFLRYHARYSRARVATPEVCTPAAVNIVAITNEQISIYPNPVSSLLNIAVNHTLLGSQLTVYDISGKQITTAQIQTLNYQLQIANLPNGVYFIEIVANQGERTLRIKFVKM